MVLNATFYISAQELQAYAKYMDTATEVANIIINKAGRIPVVPELSKLDELKIAMGGSKSFCFTSDELSYNIQLNKRGAIITLKMVADEEEIVEIFTIYGSLIEIYGKAIASSIKAFRKANGKAKSYLSQL